MIGRHPSKRALREWLAGDIETRVDLHVATCSRCSNDLDSMAAAETDGSLRDALLLVLDPGPDLALRLEAGVVARLESRDVLGYFFDVFGAGWETARLLLADHDGSRADEYE